MTFLHSPQNFFEQNLITLNVYKIASFSNDELVQLNWIWLTVSTWHIQPYGQNIVI